MKKYLLFLFAMLTGAIGAWAYDFTGGSMTTENKITTVNITTQGSFGTWYASLGWDGDDFTARQAITSNDITKIIVLGSVNASDLEYLAYNGSALYDLSGVTSTTISNDKSDIANMFGKKDNNILLPSGEVLTNYTGNSSWVAIANNSGVTEIYIKQAGGLSGALNEIGSSLQSSLKIYGDLYEADKTTLIGLSTITELELSDVKIRDEYGNVGGTLDLTSVSYTYSSSSTVTSGTVKVPVPVSNDPYTVSGCNVEINLTKAKAGQTLADLVAIAKTAMTTADPTQTNICTLTVSGELSTNDITVALSSSAMDGATRIDLSGATLASGVSLTSLNIPSSLTSLVLPKGQTVSVGLASKLTAATSLKYAYSPTSSSSRTVAEQFSPDYVYVKIPGSLSTAVSNEEGLRKGVYIKIATPSGVNLSNDDAKFGTMGIDVTDATNYGWQYVDMSDAGVTAEATLAATAPHNKGYRIILPDNLTGDHMAIFASNTNHGSVAALYSYTGTTLRILELTDGSYREDALRDPRIVRSGTTALEVVAYHDDSSNNNPYYGNIGNNLITAINGAASSITSVKIATGPYVPTWDAAWTFTNTNITSLDLEGVQDKNNPTGGGAKLNVNGCTALQTLNLNNASLNAVTANSSSLTNLTIVNLNGTKVNGNADLSNTALATLNTNGSTNITGNLVLSNTQLTNFASSATVSGHIYFNAASQLATIDLTSITLGSSSQIHIHKTDSESDTNVLEKLNIDKKYTITVPNGFVKADRLHPYSTDGTDVFDDNIAVVAAASGNTDGDGCSITYDSATKIATVHATTAGHFANLMATSYSGFPIGTTFKFDAASKINENDLKALAGTIIKTTDTTTPTLDAAWRSNYYYVDLFDIVADEATCDNTTGAIGKAIEWMRTNDRQFKGLILPKNHTQYGSGTTLIEDAANAETPVATCSEFIAYYKTKEQDGSDATKKMTVAHVYNQSNSSDGYQASFDKMSSLLRLHDDVTGANSGKGTDVFLVSTNSINKLNIDNMVANASSIEVVNNEMVASTKTDASIYAYPKKAGDFTVAVTASGLYNTPTELLKIEGPISSGIATALNSFTNGPRVLDLKDIDAEQATDEFLSTLLAALTNSHIEYIILPEGMQKSTVCRTYSSLMTSLKAVISSSATNLVAHVQQPGSLAEARYLATGGSITAETGLISPTITGLTSVTLSGNLNASDIFANDTGHKVDNTGHWTTTGSNAKPMALSGEQGTITTIDLKDAIFPTQTDMNFSYAGLSSLKNVTLPTSKSMTLICDECFMGIASLTEICVPYNYTKFGDAAFHNSSLDHLTTTDANGALIDNGPKTFTFSKKVEEIGNKPETRDANGVYSLSRNVFAHNTGVTDVYVLAHKVPKCYAYAFPANMLFGWGGFKGDDYPYCREKYDNSSDGSMIFTVLHFPDEASFKDADAKMKETITATEVENGLGPDAYTKMEQLYTDVNKVYTKKEQTGAVDANGDPIAWPTFAELRRAYNQATAGAQWYDWNIDYDAQGSINGGNYIPVGTDEYTVVAPGTYPNIGKDYSFADYEGWHQFVLSMATYVAPDEEVVDEKIERTYEQNGYYTFCIPFDMTEDEVIELLGVPASTDRVVNKYVVENGTTTTKLTNGTPKMPAIHTLKKVTRSMNGSAGKITLTLTENLASDGDGDAPKSGSYQYYIPDNIGGGEMKDNTPNTQDTRGKKIVIRGGYPYIIKPWRLSTKKDNDNDLGLDVLTRYEFSQVASCVHREGTYIQLGQSNKATSRFAVPFTGHEVQAVFSDGKSTAPAVYKEDNQTINYKYRFQGQFWEQTLPLNSYYLAKDHKWYYYGVKREGYKWKKYHSIINVNSVLDKGKSSRFTQKMKSTTEPLLDAKKDEIFEGELKNVYTDGHDDKFTSTSNETRRVIFDIEDGIIEYDGDGNEVSAIEKIDGVDVMPASGKVYDLKGLYVGNSLSDLPKGMYVVNGKKVIVK